MLFWTDNHSEPKKINIERCKSGSYFNVNGIDSGVNNELATLYGDELIDNTFDVAPIPFSGHNDPPPAHYTSGWTYSTGFTFDTTTNLFDRSGASSNSHIAQWISVDKDKVYEISYDRTYISGNNETNVYIAVETGHQSDPHITIGRLNDTAQETITVKDTFTAGLTGPLQFKVFGIGDFTGSIGNVSVKELKSEKVKEGGFTHNTWSDNYWTQGTGWDIDSYEARCDGSQTDNSWLTQKTNELIAGAHYKVKFDVTQYITGSVIVDMDGTSNSIATANGSYSYLIKSTTSYFQFMANSTFEGHVDNASAQLVTLADNWNNTTKIKDVFGEYKGNITEEDITVIKKYPLSAPNMVLSNTSKEDGDVLTTNCSTPINTTYDYDKIYWLGTSRDGGGSGDIINYQGYIYGFLSDDVIFDEYWEFGTTYFPQMQFRELFYDQFGNTIGDKKGKEFHQNDAGANGPWFKSDPDNVLAKDETYPLTNLSNTFTIQDDYAKKAFNLWAGLEDTNHFWVIKPDGRRLGLSSATKYKDFYGDRIYLRETTNQFFRDRAGGYRFGEKGDMVIFGNWYFNNNDSFWTYKDGGGNRFLKPPGTSETAAKLPDGTSVRDNIPNVDTPYFQDLEEHYLADPNDFGSGWSVGNLTLPGYTGRKGLLGAAATTTAQSGGNYGRATNQNGYQYVQKVVDGLTCTRPYFIKVTVWLKTRGAYNPNLNVQSPFGISTVSHTGSRPDEWCPGYDDESVVNRTQYKLGWRLSQHAAEQSDSALATDNGKVGSEGGGIYTLGGLIGVYNRGDGDQFTKADGSVSLNLFKTNGN